MKTKTYKRAAVWAGLLGVLTAGAWAAAPLLLEDGPKEERRPQDVPVMGSRTTRTSGGTYAFAPPPGVIPTPYAPKGSPSAPADPALASAFGPSGLAGPTLPVIQGFPPPIGPKMGIYAVSPYSGMIPVIVRKPAKEVALKESHIPQP